MGQCGCGDTEIAMIFKTGEESKLGVQFYPGCQDCSNEPAILLYHFNQAGTRTWCQGVPERDMDMTANEYGGPDGYPAVIRLPSSTDLMDAIRQVSADNGSLFLAAVEGEEPEPLEEFIESYADHIISRMVWSWRDRMLKATQ